MNRPFTKIDGVFWGLSISAKIAVLNGEFVFGVICTALTIVFLVLALMEK